MSMLTTPSNWSPMSIPPALVREVPTLPQRTIWRVLAPRGRYASVRVVVPFVVVIVVVPLVVVIVVVVVLCRGLAREELPGHDPLTHVLRLLAVDRAVLELNHGVEAL